MDFSAQPLTPVQARVLATKAALFCTREALQLHAQTQHLGLFSDGRALQPRWFRKRFGSCHTPGS